MAYRNFKVVFVAIFCSFWAAKVVLHASKGLFSGLDGAWKGLKGQGARCVNTGKWQCARTGVLSARSPVCRSGEVEGGLFW